MLLMFLEGGEKMFSAYMFNHKEILPSFETNSL